VDVLSTVVRGVEGEMGSEWTLSRSELSALLSLGGMLDVDFLR